MIFVDTPNFLQMMKQLGHVPSNNISVSRRIENAFFVKIIPNGNIPNHDIPNVHNGEKCKMDQIITWQNSVSLAISKKSN